MKIARNPEVTLSCQLTIGKCCWEYVLVRRSNSWASQKPFTVVVYCLAWNCITRGVHLGEICCGVGDGMLGIGRHSNRLVHRFGQCTRYPQRRPSYPEYDWRTPARYQVSPNPGTTTRHKHPATSVHAVLEIVFNC